MKTYRTENGLLTKTGSTMISTEIMIAARPELVWQVLTDFDQWPNFMPFLLSLKHNGPLQSGSAFKVTMAQKGDKTITFKPKVVAWKPASLFAWQGQLFIPGLFDGCHIFELIQLPDGNTLFKHAEVFNGLLVPLFKSMLVTETLPNFEATNLALKARCEALVSK